MWPRLFAPDYFGVLVGGKSFEAPGQKLEKWGQIFKKQEGFEKNAVPEQQFRLSFGNLFKGYSFKNGKNENQKILKIFNEYKK